DRPEYDLVSMQQRADPDGFYLNDGTGHFALVPWSSGRFRDESGKPLAAAPEYFGLSAKFTDIDGDGAPDLYVCNDFEDPDLFWNRGDGTFAQIAGYAGIEASDWTWDVLFLDVDLDGYEDVLATTGHLWDVMDADTWERIRIAFAATQWRRELALFPKLAVKNVAFRNNGDLTFTDVGERWGFAATDAISHGMATADLDGDG